MKAICAFHSSLDKRYIEYARVCLHTAKQCGYDPWLLHDGEGIEGIDNSIQCQSRFLPEMERILDPGRLATGRGAMLRLEIPRLFRDDFVLYTDVDVMFRRPWSWSDVGCPIRYWGMVQEARRQGHYNSGVTIMNLDRLRNTADVFDNFCRNVINAGKLPDVTWDQGLINLFYAGLIDTIPDEWNWRPYWGNNDKAHIVHLHGPKPLDTQERIERDYPKSLWPDQFYHEVEEWHRIHRSIS